MRVQNAEKEKITMDYLRGSYLRIPRKVINRMLIGTPAERQVGWLHFSLISLSFHTDGFVYLTGKRKVPCAKGEYVGSYRDLEELTGISRCTIGRLLQQLADECLIEVTRMKGGTRIRVCGYDWLTDPKREETNDVKPAVSLQPAQKSITFFSDYHGIDPNIPFT